MGVYLQPVYDRAGEVIGTLIVGRDITDLHKAQQGLKQAHADRSHILENANISIALVKDRKVVQADQPEQIL